MDTLPRELLDAVLGHLAVYDFPSSAHFPVLDDASREAILTARLVVRCFHSSKTLENLFIAVLEQTPFLWCGDQMPRLAEVARCKFAGQMSTLSLSGLNYDPWGDDDVLPQVGRSDSWTDLTNVLRRFVRVRHLRYYTISPKYLYELFPGPKSIFDVGPEVQWGYPADEENTHSWLFQQQDPSWICGNTMMNVVDADLALDSITFPLFGNRASYCAIQVTTTPFPAALKRLTISLTQRFDEVPLFEPWLENMRNLTYLDVTVSRHPLSQRPWNSFALCQKLTSTGVPTSRDLLPRLEEFRLMCDNQCCFNERDLLFGLALFPNLRKLGLAHVLIKSQLNNASSWEGFVRQLVPKALSRLWLLDPRNLWTQGTGQARRYVVVKYETNKSCRAAASDFRLIDTSSLWVKDLEPPKRRDFDYPGFAVFE